MNKNKSLATACLVTLCLSQTGCSNVRGGVIADSVTTYSGISAGIASEFNPILPKTAAGASVASAAIKLASLKVAKHIPEDKCISLTRSVTAISWGAAANNLAVLLSMGGSVPISVGALTSIASYRANANSAKKHCKRDDTAATMQPI